MEALVRGGFLAGVLDLTTTELADELVGGVLSAGPDRLEAAGELGLPQVVSLGALDMVNFGPRETVPAQFDGSQPLRPQPDGHPDADDAGGVRASSARQIARSSPRRPARPRCSCRCEGVSMIAAEGRPFHDPAADEALFSALRDGPRRRTSSCTSSTSTSTIRRSPTRWRIALARDGRVTSARGARAPTRADRRAASRSSARGAGTGLSAKCAEAGGCDLIIIYNSGRYRMAGRGSLAGLMPYGDANAIVVEMAARGAAGRRADARARGRVRHRPVPADARSSSRS